MNKHIKNIMVALFLCCVSALQAQKMSVESFNRIDRDMGARVAKVRDVNSELCALIKIETIETGFEFSGCSIEKTEQKTGEIWVFVSPGVRFLTIKHKEFGVLRNYQFPQTIESGVVYQMKLNAEGKEIKIDTSTINKAVESKIDAKLEELNRKLAELEQAQKQLSSSQSAQSGGQQLNNSQATQGGGQSTKGVIAGHEYVDLGLSVKWATCNVGANEPYEHGNYYAWGETTTKEKYKRKNSRTYDKSMGDISGNASYDVARANWGGTWRIPTETEMYELVDNCTWTWTTQRGVNGYKVTGPNGNSIFLPAAGYYYGTSRSRVGEFGGYWGSTPYESNDNNAYCLYFHSGRRGVNWGNRGSGRTVRPVSE